MAGLRLEVRDFHDLTSWRWVLTDAAGAFIADHEVRLDATCWQYEAFTDLLGYLSWHVAPGPARRGRGPDRRRARRVDRGAGARPGRRRAGQRGARHGPRDRCRGSAAAAGVAARWSSAHVGGKPLAAQDVTLVMDTGASDGPQGHRVGGERLRVLGLFSLPEGGQPLNLRRERQALVRLIERIAASGQGGRRAGPAVRRDPRPAARHAGGGRGLGHHPHLRPRRAPASCCWRPLPGSRTGSPPPNWPDLLDLARERVKLVTVSACWSAAVTAGEQRRLLGLPVPPTSPAYRTIRGPRLPTSLGHAGHRARGPPGLRGARDAVPGRRRVRDRAAAKLYELLADEGPAAAARGRAGAAAACARGRTRRCRSRRPRCSAGGPWTCTLAAPDRDRPAVLRTPTAT